MGARAALIEAMAGAAARCRVTRLVLGAGRGEAARLEHGALVVNDAFGPRAVWRALESAQAVRAHIEDDVAAGRPLGGAVSYLLPDADEAERAMAAALARLGPEGARAGVRIALDEDTSVTCACARAWAQGLAHALAGDGLARGNARAIEAAVRGWTEDERG